MLEKTLGLLTDVAPGTYLPPEQPCYDEAEIQQLGAVLRRLVYSPSELRKRLQDMGVSVIPANWYSEIPLINELEQAPADLASPEFVEGFDPQRLREVLNALMPFSAEFDPPESPPENHPVPDRFYWKGGPFSFSDAMAYYCFVRLLRPRTIVEIGPGWSTFVADAALRANGSGQLICVDPAPQPFLSGIASVARLIDQPVQSLPPEFFNEVLSDGDILFIDSTHTVKHGSDCIHLYLKVLPAIAHHITLHVHDIFLPFSLPLQWMRDRQLYWTEQYLLYAYLLDNRRAEILYGSHYHSRFNREQLNALMRDRYPAGGGSLWFTQQPRPAQP